MDILLNGKSADHKGTHNIVIFSMFIAMNTHKKKTKKTRQYKVMLLLLLLLFTIKTDVVPENDHFQQH